MVVLGRMALPLKMTTFTWSGISEEMLADIEIVSGRAHLVP
jgi:hypothetical protein